MTLFGKRSIDWRLPISQRGNNPVKRLRRSLQFSLLGRRIRFFIQGACIAVLSVFLGGQHWAYSQTGSTVDGPSVNNRVSAGEVKPHFVDLLTDFERKLEQQAQQAELLSSGRKASRRSLLFWRRSKAALILWLLRRPTLDASGNSSQKPSGAMVCVKRCRLMNGLIP